MIPLKTITSVLVVALSSVLTIYTEPMSSFAPGGLVVAQRGGAIPIQLQPDVIHRSNFMRISCCLAF